MKTVLFVAGLVLAVCGGCAPQSERLMQKRDALIRRYTTAEFDAAQRAIERYLSVIDYQERRGLLSRPDCDRDRWPAEGRLALMHAAAGKPHLYRDYMSLAVKHYHGTDTSDVLTMAEMHALIEKLEQKTNPEWRRVRSNNISLHTTTGPPAP